MPALSAIVLAAGLGKRMRSSLPKVMHPLAGRPMLHYVVQAALEAGCDEVVVVVGHEKERVTAYLAEAFDARVRTVVQAEQRGTGHAARCALPALRDDAAIALLVAGDAPLIEPSTLASLVRALEEAPTASLAFLSAVLDDPAGYGRVLRDPGGEVTAIREERDASPREREVREVNVSLYAARVPFLRDALASLSPDNAQGELYLTDVVARAAATRGAVSRRGDAATVIGVNDRAQLAAAEEAMHARIAHRLRVAGATVRAGARIDDGVVVEPDAVIEPFAVLRGATVVGAGARVDVGCVLTDVKVAPRAALRPYTVATSSVLGEGAQVGPFAHLRPESDVGPEAHVGNFVETKKTTLRRGAKANHLAYLGDGEIGEGANVGAGTIFCNYDGYRKHRTVIGKGAFIGSDSQLVAPVTVGAGAYVATGTTVTRDVPDEGLAIARVKQENKEGYAPRLRARLRGGKG